MKQKINTKNIFYKKIIDLKNKKDVNKFFANFFSQNEINEFANRFYVASLLNKNITYSKIQEQTKISSRTIAKISKKIKNKKNNFVL